MQTLQWRFVTEALPWAGVELGGNGVASVLREKGHAGALAEVLADQAVGILIGPALPGVVRVREIECGRCTALDFSIVVKLGPVIRSDRFEQRALAANDLNGPRIHCDCRSAGELSDHNESRFAFDQAENAIPAAFAHHRVDLPVPELAAALH